MSTRLLIAGAAGRMGHTLVRLARQSADLSLVAAVERAGSPAVGQDVGAVANVGPTGITVQEDLSRALESSQAQVVIDFTHPEASVAHARTCAALGVPLVVGTTGFSPQARAELSACAQRVALVVAPNMSVGVNVVFHMAARLAQVLGEAYDVEVLEVHHRRKKDAPSGTALRLAEGVAQALGRTPDSLTLARQGMVGERTTTEIGVQALRGGDVVGEHTVFFLGEGERVELTHRATSRDPFGLGALRAARWVVGRPAGLYDMADVLGMRS